MRYLNPLYIKIIRIIILKKNMCATCLEVELYKNTNGSDPLFKRIDIWVDNLTILDDLKQKCN